MTITITQNKAAQMWGIDRRTVWARIKSGDLKTVTDPITKREGFDVEYVKEVIRNGLPWRRKQA